jgi:hypothetical protein
MQQSIRIRPGPGDARNGTPAAASLAQDLAGQPPRHIAKRLLLAAATAFLSINLWTGSPVLALWVGSMASEDHALSMMPLFVILVTFLALSLAISAALLWLEERYRILVGLPLREARLTWLRPFNAQREPVRHVPTSLLERIVVFVVYIAVALFLVWFLFFAGSPLGDYAQYA